MNKFITFIKYAALGFSAIFLGLVILMFYLKEHSLDDEKKQCVAILAKPMPAWPDCAAEMAPKPEPEGSRGPIGLRSTFGGCAQINDNSERARYDDCKKYGLPRDPDFYKK